MSTSPQRSEMMKTHSIARELSFFYAGRNGPPGLVLRARVNQLNTPTTRRAQPRETLQPEQSCDAAPGTGFKVHTLRCTHHGCCSHLCPKLVSLVSCLLPASCPVFSPSRTHQIDSRPTKTDRGRKPGRIAHQFTSRACFFLRSVSRTLCVVCVRKCVFSEGKRQRLIQILEPKMRRNCFARENPRGPQEIKNNGSRLFPAADEMQPRSLVATGHTATDSSTYSAAVYARPVELDSRTNKEHPLCSLRSPPAPCYRQWGC